jgi:hypothetical protein
VFTRSLLCPASAGYEAGAKGWPTRSCPIGNAVKITEYYLNDEPRPEDNDSDEEIEEKEEEYDPEIGYLPPDDSDSTDSEVEMEVEERLRADLECAGLTDDESMDDSEAGGGGRKAYRVYEYHFRNTHSGEKFHVLLKSVPCREDCDDEETKREVQSVEFLLDP